jgi:hypothetical protein
LCDVVLCLFQQSAAFLELDKHQFREPGLAEVHSLREKAVRDDIARRLGHICSNFSREEFEKLVGVMAARQVKRERRPIW